ncbi:hypothetical protein [Bacillus carboniphilus]
MPLMWHGFFYPQKAEKQLDCGIIVRQGVRSGQEIRYRIVATASY